MSLELQQKVYTTCRQGLKPERVIPAPVKSFSGIRSVWMGKMREKNPKHPSPEKWWLRQRRDRTGRSPPGTMYSPAESPAISAGHKGFCEPWSYPVASSPAQPEFKYPKRAFSRSGNRESKSFTTPLSKHHSPKGDEGLGGVG